MNDDTAKALAEALKSIAEGQKQIIEEIKSLKTSGDMVPIRMPDGSTQLVKRDKLQATTQGNTGAQLRSIEHEPITQEPWPDPNIPKPKIQR